VAPLPGVALTGLDQIVLKSNAYYSTLIWPVWRTTICREVLGSLTLAS
jgi:hypothetical protein